MYLIIRAGVKNRGLIFIGGQCCHTKAAAMFIFTCVYDAPRDDGILYRKRLQDRMSPGFHGKCKLWMRLLTTSKNCNNDKWDHEMCFLYLKS